LIEQNGDSRNSYKVKVGGVGIKDMMMLEKVGVHVGDWWMV